MTPLRTLSSSSRCFGGDLVKFTHASSTIGLDMNLNVFFPKPLAELQAAGARVPWLLYLSGLTCTEDNVMQKSGLQRAAARLGIAVVAPDTSPRKTGVEGADASWDFGTGAGFYLNATQAPWSKHWRMYDYLVDELYALLPAELPLDGARVSIFGHSMGGLGALVLGLRNPDKFKSVSAFAPMAHPSACKIGQKAFAGYLGADSTEAWKQYDPTELVSAGYRGPERHLLIDQGAEDGFYKDATLLPDDFVQACAQGDVALQYRLHPGYDHSYYFVASFIDEHIEHHAKWL